jgi:hypothetical protein
MAITTEATFFANKGTISVAGDGGSPSAFPVGVVKDIEITVSAEHVPLFGFASIQRKGVARHSGKVGVRIGFAKFKPASGNWLFYIADPVGGTGALTDVNTVKLFDVTVTFTNEASPNETLTALIQDVYFTNFPMKAAEGQWIRLDLEGEGVTISYT